MKQIEIVILLLMAFLVSSCVVQKSPQDWEGIGSLDVDIATNRALSFLIEQNPEFKNVEIKFVQAISSYYAVKKPSLTVIFIHENSFKTIEENQTLGAGEVYGLKYYMEMLHVEFSASGEPIEITVREPLLGVDEQKSRERFLSTYNSY